MRPAAPGIFPGTGHLVSVVRSRESYPVDRSTALNITLVIATFVVGLIVDRNFGVAGQLAVSAWSWGLMFWLLRTSPREWRLAFWACLVWATAGEIFLSLVWGLYTYRLENVPFFIPPGHVLLFWLGLTLASRTPNWFVILVPAAAVGYAVVAWPNGIDTISIPLIALFIFCMLQREGRRLYAVMFVAALSVEFYATWMGNWLWHPDVPHFGFNSANPPIAAGSFYCMLDVLVALTVRRILHGYRCSSAATIGQVYSSAGEVTTMKRRSVMPVL